VQEPGPDAVAAAVRVLAAGGVTAAVVRRSVYPESRH
jgi:hypothetical protein